MTKRKRYLYADTDRNGNQRLYFKPPGHRKIRIRHAAGTREANDAYRQLMADYEAGNLATPSKTTKPGTCEWLLNQYVASAAFRERAPNTQLQRRNFYKRFNKVHGSYNYADLTSRDLSTIRDTLGPGAGRNFLNSMSAAFDWACLDEVGLADFNPAKGVKRPQQSKRGYEKWSIEEVIQFKNHYDHGHPARLCLALLLFTGREISGIRTLGRKDVRDGMIRGHRQKTWTNNALPMLPTLRAELGDRYKDMIWLQANHGGPYSAKSLSQRFTAWANAAGLENRTSHGLRKSVGTILANLGLSDRTIMAALAHSDPRQAQAYVQDANTRALAATGMQALEAEVAHFWESGKVGNASI